MRIQLPLDISSDILIFSPPRTQSSDKAEEKTKNRLNVGFHVPPHLPPHHLCSTAPFQVSFLMIDSDRAKQSFTVPACLPAAASGVRLMQSRLTAGPVSDCWPMTPNSDRAEIWRAGRKEAHFQDSQLRKKNNSQSSLSQCLYIVTSCKGFAGLFSIERRKGDANDYEMEINVML